MAAEPLHTYAVLHTRRYLASTSLPAVPRPPSTLRHAAAQLKFQQPLAPRIGRRDQRDGAVRPCANPSLIAQMPTARLISSVVSCHELRQSESQPA